MARRWSANQLELLRLRDYEERFILGLGDIGAGKTSSALAGFFRYASRFRNASFGLIALTSILVKQKLMPEVRKFCADYKLTLPKVRHNTFRLFGNDFLILSGNNARRADYIQGLNLQGAFIDEATTIPYEILDEVNNRLRYGKLKRAKMVMTANPASPANTYGFEFKKRWFDRADELGMRVIYLVEGDNPEIDDAFYDSQRKTGTAGSRARRLGGGKQWVSDGNKVIPFFHPPTQAPEEGYGRYGFGVDIAFSSVTHALIFGWHEDTDTWWVLDEWRYNGEQEGALPASDQCFRIAQWCKDYQFDYVTYDSAQRALALNCRVPSSRWLSLAIRIGKRRFRRRAYGWKMAICDCRTECQN